MSQQYLGSINLNTQSILRTAQSYAGSFFGFGEDTVAPEQAVVITAKSFNNQSLVFALQDGFELDIESLWDSLMSISGDNSYLDIGNVLLQMVSGGQQSLVNKETSRRYWKGSTPIKMTLPLKLDAENNAKEEVTNKIKALMSLALPSDIGFMGFLAPPGPSPFKPSGSREAASTQDEAYWNIQDASDEISIAIGNGFLYFDNVIIKNVHPKIYNMFAKDGSPIAADIDLEFQTYTVVTKEKMIDIFNGTISQPSSNQKDNKFFKIAKTILDL